MPAPFTIPGAPAELMDRINARMARIPAGMMMMADEQGAKPGDEQAKGDTQGGNQKGADLKGGDDDKLGDGGVKALHAEREARKALEKQVADLQASAKVVDEIRKAFVPEANADPTKTIADQIAELQAWKNQREKDDARDALALKVADELNVTDLNDLSLIRAQADEASMRALAARLNAGAKPGTPKPNMRVGHGGDSGKGGGSVSAGRDAFRERHNKN